MSRARPYSPENAAAASSSGRGCLPAFLLAPLAVLLFGAGMMALSPDPIAGAALPKPPDGMSSTISPVFTPQIQYWSASILRRSAQAEIDPNLVAVIMQIESCGDPGAQSHAGALGLFQVMPYHFQPGEDPYAPDTNALRGMAYLKRALSASGEDIRLALAGYNGGISVIAEPDWLWPAETGRYAYWGSGIYNDAMSGTTSSPRLAEWLAAGGSSLCRRAGLVLKL